MVRNSGQDRATAASSVAGGFVLVKVSPLMACWGACQARPLGIGDFRTWLACHELRARRCLAEEGRAVTYSFAELAKLLGVTERRARASVGRLFAAGLLEWSEGAIGFPNPPVTPDDLQDTIGRGRGSLAIPRRMLRFLVSGARPALIATVLGILLRCLSRRLGGFDGRGRVKASWIARVFCVDLRRIKAARRELVDLGWIEPEASDQRIENRYGRAYRIDLGWDRVRADGRSLPPLPPADRPAIATPSVDPEPLPEREKNQEPARSGPAGVRIEGQGIGEKPRPAPTLADVRPEDLRETGRTLKLFDQAVAGGLVGSSEHDRLKFLALAEHARVVGTVNPGGLFASLLRRSAWAFVTQAEEDLARRRLREHLRGQERPPGRAPSRESTFVPDRHDVGPSSLASLMTGIIGRIGA